MSQIHRAVICADTSFQGRSLSTFTISTDVLKECQIERYARFITINADIQTRLTAAERDHASRHVRPSAKAEPLTDISTDMLN